MSFFLEKLPPLEFALAIYAIALPLSLTFAYVFYWFFERLLISGIGKKQASIGLNK
jgi:peptidoglycan/LPS O-acetylase OafA/YrhL